MWCQDVCYVNLLITINKNKKTEKSWTSGWWKSKNVFVIYYVCMNFNSCYYILISLGSYLDGTKNNAQDFKIYNAFLPMFGTCESQFIVKKIIYYLLPVKYRIAKQYAENNWINAAKLNAVLGPCGVNSKARSLYR